jgi:hypothetical protein
MIDRGIPLVLRNGDGMGGLSEFQAIIKPPSVLFLGCDMCGLSILPGLGIMVVNFFVWLKIQTTHTPGLEATKRRVPFFLSKSFYQITFTAN